MTMAAATLARSLGLWVVPADVGAFLAEAAREHPNELAAAMADAHRIVERRRRLGVPPVTREREPADAATEALAGRLGERMGVMVIDPARFVEYARREHPVDYAAALATT